MHDPNFFWIGKRMRVVLAICGGLGEQGLVQGGAGAARLAGRRTSTSAKQKGAAQTKSDMVKSGHGPLHHTLLSLRLHRRGGECYGLGLMISLQDARAKLLAACPEPLIESIPLAQAVGRILREDLVAAEDRPCLDRAAMDGYAVRHADLAPGKTLACARTAYAGHAQTQAIASEEAVRVSTGAALPPGTDTVLRKEYGSLAEDVLTVQKVPVIGQDIRPRGEEWKQGEALLSSGSILTPPMIAVAAANRCTTLCVQKKPAVRILSSGDEIASQARDSVPDSNGPLLAAFCQTKGVQAQLGDVLLDCPLALQAKLKVALQGVDLLITSGGMSVGDKDGMVPAAKALGATILFHRVDLRPGRPIGAARLGQTLWLMLPGSPGAVTAGAELFLGPLLAAMGAPGFQTSVQHPARSLSDAPDHVRLRWSHIKAGPLGWEVQSPAALNPHHLMSPIRSDGFVVSDPSQNVWLGYVGQAPKEPWSWPACVAITGPSGSGKTTLIRRLLEHLSPKHRVVVIKHSHHKVPPEAPHKDTARFRQAGAACVFFVSGNEFVLRSSGEDWTRPQLQAWVSRLDPRPDLILIEGFSSFKGPRLEVLGPEDPRSEAELLARAGDHNLLACVVRGRAAPRLEIPVFDSESVEAVANWLLKAPATAAPRPVML